LQLTPGPIGLRFDPKVPEFSVHETERAPELYTALFADLRDVAPESIRNRNTQAFLRAFVQSVSPADGVYVEQADHPQTSESPVIWRDPVFFLQRCEVGIANVVDAVIDDIDSRELFPPALAQITGTIELWEDSAISSPAVSGNGERPSASRVATSDDEILLSKEANAEQLQIIRRLSSSGSVIGKDTFQLSMTGVGFAAKANTNVKAFARPQPSG
jgi:hypothetical protein